MFSRTEREFLELIAQAPRGAGDPVLEGRFPNPVYRRRLLWGIRRKASAAALDWELYARAAAQDDRVVAASDARPGSGIPLHSEPLAALFKRLVRPARDERRKEAAPPREDRA